MARPSLVRHRKFRRALNALRIPRAHLLGHLEILWHSAYEVGHDLVGDALDVELAAEWEGERGAFARALTEAGFLVEEGGVYHVHDLLDNAPGYVKDRWKKREKRAAEKAKRSDPSEERRDKSSTVPDKSDSRRKSACTPIPYPYPYREIP